MSNESESRNTKRRRSNTSEKAATGKNMTVQEAGHMGGQKVRKLIEEGKEHEKE